MALIIDTLSCRRGGRLVLSAVSARVEAGRALVLRGPNGVGKTTLLRCLAGFVPVSGGGATLNGEPLAGDHEGVALAGHLDAVKPAMTVAETLRFWAALHGSDAEAALLAFDLAPLAERPAGRLSAGQKRRLGLARLPLTRARLWLLDEPTVALDTGAVAALLALLQGHLAGGGIALVSTHQTLALDADTLTLAPPSEDAHAADPFLEGFET